MILPDFAGAQFSYWNTNDWARQMADAQEHSCTTSVFMNPNRKERLSEHAKRVLSADVLYGGYLEDRSFLWRGSYMEPSKFLHLGIDFAVPAGTRVQIDEIAKLVQVYDDTPEESGWGTRLMFKLLYEPDIHLVFGHLEPNPALHQVGEPFHPHHYAHIGNIGTNAQNGGWSPHLHVQAIRGDVQEFLDNPAGLDGYGELSEIEALAHRYPDPLRYISIR